MKKHGFDTPDATRNGKGRTIFVELEVALMIEELEKSVDSKLKTIKVLSLALAVVSVIAISLAIRLI